MDTATDEPAAVTVRTGLPTGRRLAFVLLDDVLLGPGYVKISYTRSLVRKAPSIGTDDILPAEQKEAILQHYGVTYQPGANGERKLGRR